MPLFRLTRRAEADLLDIANLTPLTTVGVRVSLYDSTGPGPWSQVVSRLVY